MVLANVAAAQALEHGTPVRRRYALRNVNRTVGAMLSGEVARRYGHAGLPAFGLEINAGLYLTSNGHPRDERIRSLNQGLRVFAELALELVGRRST